jgi:hypothetical protein
MLPSVSIKTSASAIVIDFGAESSRPTFSLSTLHSRRSPAVRQDSLPACPLQLWPNWTFTSWILSKGFIRSHGLPLSQALLGAICFLRLSSGSRPKPRGAHSLEVLSSTREYIHSHQLIY